MIKHRFKGRDLLSLIRELTYLILNPDKVYELVIREYKERRSLQVNNYSWALTDCRRQTQQG